MKTARSFPKQTNTDFYRHKNLVNGKAEAMRELSQLAYSNVVSVGSYLCDIEPVDKDPLDDEWKIYHIQHVQNDELVVENFLVLSKEEFANTELDFEFFEFGNMYFAEYLTIRESEFAQRLKDKLRNKEKEQIS